MAVESRRFDVFTDYQIKRMEQIQGLAHDVQLFDGTMETVKRPFHLDNRETGQKVIVDDTFITMCKGGLLGLIAELKGEGLGYEAEIIVSEAKAYGKPTV